MSSEKIVTFLAEKIEQRAFLKMAVLGALGLFAAMLSESPGSRTARAEDWPCGLCLPASNCTTEPGPCDPNPWCWLMCDTRIGKKVRCCEYFEAGSSICDHVGCTDVYCASRTVTSFTC